MVSYNSPIDRIYQYLIIAACFFLPLFVVPNNIAIWSVVIIWLLSGNYLAKINEVRKNKLAIASIIFFCIHLLGLLWTDNISWGLEISRKMLPFFLVLPIFLTIVRRENIKYYVFAFLFAMAISETLSYLIWFGVIEPFKYATIDNPTPLQSHISYNPFLAFAIYLVLNHLFSDNQISQKMRIFYTFFLLTMTFNMFITGGRAGQVMFFVAIILFAFQSFRNSQLKAMFVSIISLVIIVSVAYNTSPLFNKRMNTTYSTIVNYSELGHQHSGLGVRVEHFRNSFELFKKSPIIGIGTGDYPDEYEKVNQIRTPDIATTVQPHNMYILVLSQLGLVGFLSFLWIFIIQFKISLISKSKFVNHVGVALPLLFMVIMWSDSYLLGHYTSNLFILFSSFLYNNR